MGSLEAAELEFTGRAATARQPQSAPVTQREAQPAAGQQFGSTEIRQTEPTQARQTVLPTESPPPAEGTLPSVCSTFLTQ